MAVTGLLSGFFSKLSGRTSADAYIPFHVKEEGRKAILFQGDSITDGNRGRNNDPNHIMGHGYAFSIASRIGADYPQKFTFINKGVSGNKITDMGDRWQRDTLALEPDILSILIGVNDASSVVFKWDPYVTSEEYLRLYDFLLQETIARLPDITLVLCEPFILKVGNVEANWEAYSEDMTARRKAVRKLAENYNALFVEFQEVFDKACKHAPADYWIWDGIHPTVAGHELMARKWLETVTPSMGI